MCQLRPAQDVCSLKQWSMGNNSLCFILGADVPSPHQKPPALSVFAFRPPQWQLKGENELVLVLTLLAAVVSVLWDEEKAFNKVIFPPSQVIYMARNPKDLVVSYYQFHRSLRTMSYRGTFQEFCRRFMNDKCKDLFSLHTFIFISAFLLQV